MIPVYFREYGDPEDRLLWASNLPFCPPHGLRIRFRQALWQVVLVELDADREPPGLLVWLMRCL